MSSVHYLVPGQGVWAQRASEQTLDLIEDPFWRVTQATIASKDGIVWRCGNALTGIGVERSTDAGLTWSDVTPSTNPPNDNGDSPAPLADNVIYTHIDGSRVAQGTFVVVANWQAGVPSLGDWRSWMAITDDDGVTCICQAVQHVQQLLDVGEVQAGGGLVQDVQGVAAGRFAQLGGQLDPLGFPA